MPQRRVTAQNATANIVIFSETAAIFGQKNSIIPYNCGK
jgi:hypothetical protein